VGWRGEGGGVEREEMLPIQAGLIRTSGVRIDIATAFSYSIYVKKKVDVHIKKKVEKYSQKKCIYIYIYIYCRTTNARMPMGASLKNDAERTGVRY
jgi:hypothetical protein